jgi:hypothetical protein
MNQETTISAIEISFNDFLFKSNRNRTVLYFAAAAIVVQFSIFKYLYPYASYIHGDSFSYLNAAFQNLNINTYMIGYSRFLRLFSVFSQSDLVLTAFQYLLIHASALFLLFTIFYFYKPGKIIQYILLVFMVFNPLFLHLANLVSSDCMFAGLSITWFAILLWLIHRPFKYILIWQAIILVIVFSIRYNALIYPAIAALAFRLSPLPWRKKWSGIGLGLLLCGLLVTYTSYHYKRLTGYWQYSPFSGWQMANNAMYAYRYVDSAARKPVPPKYQTLDNMIRQFFDSTHDTKRFPSETAMASTVYMWTPWMPLMKYRNNLFKKSKDTTASELKKWSSMGPFYKSYGTYIIKQYPWHFIRYFLYPSARKYYAPPVEFLQQFNSGKTSVPDIVKNWFNYKSTKIKTRMKSPKTWILNFYPILSGIINVLMLFGLLYYILLKGWQYNRIFHKTIILAGAVWLLNAGFTISASSAALRFQSFPILLSTTFSLLLVDWMTQIIKIMKMHQNKQRKVDKQISSEVMA